MIVADESARELSLGVEDLIDAGEHGAGPAPLAGPESLPAARAARMAALERARAEGARTELEREVPLTWRDWTLHIAVSADVLRPDARGAALEQIRVVPDADPDAGAARALERAGFAALLFDLAGEPIARVAVVELSLEGARPLRRDVAFRRDAWLELLRARLDELAHRAELELGRAQRRRAQEPPFPFGAPRPVQAELAREVAGAAASGLVLLCAAPTGVGKTAAALHPFLCDALRSDRRVVFATSRNSQQALALETLRPMLPPGGAAFALQIAARERVCPQAQLGCVERRCPFNRRFVERLAGSGLLDELAERGVVSGVELTDAALPLELCPFEVSLRLAQRHARIEHVVEVAHHRARAQRSRLRSSSRGSWRWPPVSRPCPSPPTRAQASCCATWPDTARRSRSASARSASRSRPGWSRRRAASGSRSPCAPRSRRPRRRRSPRGTARATRGCCRGAKAATHGCAIRCRARWPTCASSRRPPTATRSASPRCGRRSARRSPVSTRRRGSAPACGPSTPPC